MGIWGLEEQHGGEYSGFLYCLLHILERVVQRTLTKNRQ